jgi:hypothetical protein
MYIFKGGPNFGSKRLHLDSADYEMKDPRFYDHSGKFNGMDGWGTGAANVGDLTGTGRSVITTGGTVNGRSAALNFYYVLNDATDDKADMFEAEDYGISGADTTASYKYPVGSMFSVAPLLHRLELLHGSNRIPIHINPIFRNVRHSILTESIDIYPNPCTDHLSGTLAVGEPAFDAVFTLRNILGQLVHGWHQPLSADGTFTHDIHDLASGNYTLECRFGDRAFFSRITVLR